MATLIEKYLKKLLSTSSSGVIEIKRNELASEFDCVPSQINYVLRTRFNLEEGYVVESRKGGGGYVRIAKITIGDLPRELHDLQASTLSQKGAHGLIGQLLEGGLISSKEADLLMAITHRSVLGLSIAERDQLRARILKAALERIFRYK